MKKWLYLLGLLVVSPAVIWISSESSKKESATPSKYTEPSHSQAEVSVEATPKWAKQQTSKPTEPSHTEVEPVETTPLKLELPGAAAEAGLHAWEIAQSPLTDEQYYQIAEFLKNDPEFMLAMMAEFQGSIDLERSRVLAALLGEVEHAALPQLAADMVASGNPVLETAALDLLGNIQHRDPRAREQVLQIIDTRTEKPVLVSALGALARGDLNASIQDRTEIANRLTPLIQHPESTVRKHSYALLFRWASDFPSLAPLLRSGLKDKDPSIRRITALSYLDYPSADEATKLELFSMLNNTHESPRNRRAAASALKRLALSADEAAHVNAVVKSLRAIS